MGTESVTFLSNQENTGTLYSIPGLDYVGHEDVLPYQTTEKQPIHNHLFEKFLQHDSESGLFIIVFISDKNHKIKGAVFLVQPFFTITRFETNR